MSVRRSRSAYTLLEILLVLAIIVIAAAMFVPSLESMFGHHKVKACVDSVSGGWLTARGQAIEDSRPYRFSVSGRFWRVAPDDDSWWGAGDAPNDSDNPGAVYEGSLPEGFYFSGDANDSAVHHEDKRGEDDKPPSNGSFVTRCIFLPDGTAMQDGKFEFKLAGTRTRTIRLRALTGTIEIKIEGEEDN